MGGAMQIESQEGMIQLPVDQLLNPAGTETNMNGWTQKMRDTFHAMGGRAREAGKIAYHRASESYSRVASAVRTGAPWSICRTLDALWSCPGAFLFVLELLRLFAMACIKQLLQSVKARSRPKPSEKHKGQQQMSCSKSHQVLLSQPRHVVTHMSAATVSTACRQFWIRPCMTKCDGEYCIPGMTAFEV